MRSPSWEPTSTPNGGKVLLAAGTPSATPTTKTGCCSRSAGARRRRFASRCAPVSNRGRIFAVDLGSPARRTYTVMGDAVNLAARVMGHGTWGELPQHKTSIDHRHTEFALVPLEPFTVKGKSAPIHAQIVGAVRGRRTRRATRRCRSSVVTPRSRPSAPRSRPRTGRRAHRRSGRRARHRQVEARRGCGRPRPRTQPDQVRGRTVQPCHAVLRAAQRSARSDGVDRRAHADEVEGVLRSAVEGFAPDLEPWIPLLAVPLGLRARRLAGDRAASIVRCARPRCTTPWPS